METVLYLVRHGMHDWLRPGANRLAGRLPGIPLNAEGRRQAQAIADRLAAVPLRWVAASPIQRTMETAEIIARPHGLEVTPDERLIEWALGPWEGMWIAEIQALYPEQWRIWREDPIHLRLEGAETLEEVAARMEAAAAEWMERGGHGVIVSHQDPLAALLCRLMDMPLCRMRALDVAPGSVSVVRRSRHGTVVEAVNSGVLLV
ncbi:MAG: histidine phosphatase family protein [Armatimonadota bacterium]|nr:histidine phosphatase family protein [Armatimonadota bacterium]MDR7451913.1 histidine phosphatase family protein [Armatimonadota bacterium]MDR7466595.1 histidine phosphatase family protein [Armatimonadota bacterium]MDR7495083.1 histidine phosphatase family protein [Armatimonadota bacterium]MDR7500328.1 histidine phosphatase family protein [Armatimonadota bacterium]